MSARAGQGNQVVEAREGAREGRQFAGGDVVPVDAAGSQVEVALPVGLEPVGNESRGECTAGDELGLEEAARLQAQLVESRPA